jgi:hydrogenase nickel incorporation protein HypA/HybF
MHELPVTQSIVNICLEEAEKNGVKRIDKINIVEGELSDMVPESISMYFELLTKDTPLMGATLNIKKVPGKIKCLDCGAEEDYVKGVFNCRNCGSNKVRISGGREFYIDSMEAEDDGN